MARYYTETEMARRYTAGQTMTFARGLYHMTAETAEKLTYGLVEEVDHSGLYRRINWDPGGETALINEAHLRDRLRAGASAPSPWSPTR